jgi:hypothetical protein
MFTGCDSYLELSQPPMLLLKKSENMLNSVFFGNVRIHRLLFKILGSLNCWAQAVLGNSKLSRLTIHLMLHSWNLERSYQT